MVKETEMISKRRNATTVKEIGCSKKQKERNLSMHSNENTGKRKKKRARCAAASDAVDAADAVKQTDREHMS